MNRNFMFLSLCPAYGRVNQEEMAIKNYFLIVLVSMVLSEPVWAESADDLAKELSNPTTAMASLNNNLEYRTYEGKLPGANRQDSFTYILQPSMPFPQGDGKNIIFRPAISVLVDQPVFEPARGGFSREGVELGDIGFDLAYGGTDEMGFISKYQ